MSEFVEHPFGIGRWQVYPKQNLLIDSSTQAQLEIAPNLMNLLVYLSQRSEQVVSRDELIGAVWQGSIVSDESVSRSIAHLRKLLDDSAKNPLYIKTISKQGYQFLLKPQSLSGDVEISVVEPKNVQNWLNGMALTIFVLVVLVGGWILYGNETSEPGRFAQMHKQVLSSQINVNRHPRFSPDGRFVVNEVFQQGSNALVLWDLQANNQRVLFESATESYTLPTFSPSGNDLVYLKYAAQRDGKGSACEILIYTFKTNQSRVIKACDKLYSTNFSWTKDGRQLLASELKKSNATAGLVTIDVNDGKVTELVFPPQNNRGYLFARLSPSNNKVAFVVLDGYSNQAQLGIYDRLSKQVTTPVPQFNRVQQVVWGQDDNEIYFSDTAATGAGIWHFALDSGKTTFIYNALILDFDVDPNTDRFIANLNESDLNIWQAKQNEQGEWQKKPLLNSTVSEYSPAISDDGQWLAYIAAHGGIPNLWVKDLQNGEERQISQLEGGLLSVAKWSKDNLNLAIIHTVSEQSELLVFDVRQPNKIIARLKNVTDADWHGNTGQLTVILNHQDKPGVYLLDLQSGDLSLLLSDPLFQLSTITPGHYVVQKQKLGPLFRLALDGGSAQLFPLPSGQHVMNWQLRHGKVSVFSMDDRDDNAVRGLIYFDAVTGQILTDFNGAKIALGRQYFMVDEQHNQLYYVKNKHNSMALVLIKPL